MSHPHFDHLTRLLHLEAKAEQQRLKDLAAQGLAEDGGTLTRLAVVSDDAGLGGRVIRTFARQGRSDPLPPTRLGPGSPVLLTQLGSPRPLTARGVVSERTDRTVSVAFERSDQEWPDDALWRLDRSPDEVSRKRQVAALHRVAGAEKDRLAELRAVLLGEASRGRQPPEESRNPGLTPPARH